MICQVVLFLGFSDDLWVLLGVVLADGVVNCLLDLCLHFAFLGLELFLGAFRHRQWLGSSIQCLNSLCSVQSLGECLQEAFRVLGLVVPLLISNSLSDS